jgi:chaperonin GroEL (HSP60 family)
VDATASGILDALETRHRCYVAAVEVASLLVGIDDAIPADPPEPAPDPDDAIYEDAAEQQQSYLSEHDDTRWDE